jgi:hypothetical protein
VNTFRYERLGFEISLPDEWHEATSVAPGGGSRQVAFSGDDAKTRSIHIAVGALWKLETEPSLDDTLAFFKRYVGSHNYSQVTHGSLRIQAREFFWGQYLMPQGVLVRKYSATVDRVEYIITCQYGLGATITEKDIRRAEREYDDILSTFRITGTATAESLRSASRRREGASISQKAPMLFKVIVVCLFSAVLTVAAWAGWLQDQLQLAPWMMWLWTIGGGLLGSWIVFRDSRGAGAPLLVAAILGLGVLAGWASILFATGLL